MTGPQPISVLQLNRYPAVDEQAVERLLQAELAATDRSVVALDDDPTGVQTVHGVSVFTTWDEAAIREGFSDGKRLFFLLTNSRGMTAEETVRAHREIADNLTRASQAEGRDYILISRSDSTLRGHYPLETATLREEIEKRSDKRFDGEILLPFFREGGRFTMDNIHYVQEGDRLVPAGMTEFARDRTFGYTASDLGAWIEEKTGGVYPRNRVTFITMEELRALDYAGIQAKLEAVEQFGKVVVNVVDYVDVKIFAVAFLRALRRGKEFLFRSAAAVTKVLGGVPDAPLLTRSQLIQPGNRNGGIVIVGSHVNKTTRQLECLRQADCPMAFLEFNQHLVLEPGGLEGEVARVDAAAEELLAAGRSVAIYTRRERFDLDTDDKDLQLQVSVRISDALTSIIGLLKVRPSFIVAKGGITSSDVGTKALKVRRALVMGQISPGIPVWMTGEESKFPHMPYVIFPGNVGGEQTLREIVEELMDRGGEG